MSFGKFGVGFRFNALGLLFLILLNLSVPLLAWAEPTPEMINEAMRRSGLSREEVLRLYAENKNGTNSSQNLQQDETQQEPGRQDLEGIDDSRPQANNVDPFDRKTRYGLGDSFQPTAVLPFDMTILTRDSLALDVLDSLITELDAVPLFGQSFFELDEGLFTPPSFGPVPQDYLLGVGDEVVVDVWGGVELRLTRIVDRDGAVILPRVGKIACAGRSLEQVSEDILHKLAQNHSSINESGPGTDTGSGETSVQISLGSLRGIRVFVIGEITRPGSYELSSISTVLGALYAAGGPSESGTLRDVRLVRGGQVLGSLDLYGYLLNGTRDGDRALRDGDTILVPGRGPTVSIKGEVKRPIRFEMKKGEKLGDLFRYAGGFTAMAAPSIVHLRRIVPVNERLPGQPDMALMDIPFDAIKMQPVSGDPFLVSDGCEVLVDAIDDRLENWVEVLGSVKQPGFYEFQPGMRAAELITIAGGLWPDALTERATIDRIGENRELTSVSFNLDAELIGSNDPVLLTAMDELTVFSRWDVQDRPQVHITGEVFEEISIDHRQGLTLRDLILKAGGLKQSADLFEAQINRVRLDAVRSHDMVNRPNQTIEVINVSLGEGFLLADESVPLMAHDRVAIRKLPWWELQRTVTLSGEIFYPGVFSLERQDERLSSMISRAGGLKPDAYLLGARVIRKQDGVGNIAIDLMKALTNPGSQFDLVLQDGDQILIPDNMHTVKVVGEVGFPTSLIFEDDKDIDYYVNRAGGYLELADEDKARVVWPNGASFANKGGSRVVAGSTIIVPIKPPPEGATKLQTMREITGILAGLATVWLVIESTTR